jgi:hypothetical protein
MFGSRRALLAKLERLMKNHRPAWLVRRSSETMTHLLSVVM